MSGHAEVESKNVKSVIMKRAVTRRNVMVELLRRLVITKLYQLTPVARHSISKHRSSMPFLVVFP